MLIKYHIIDITRRKKQKKQSDNPIERKSFSISISTRGGVSSELKKNKMRKQLCGPSRLP